MKLLALCLAVVLLVDGAVAGPQSVAIQGYLTCDGKPAVGVKVKLYDENTISTDNKLAEGKTDSKGFYSLQGSEKSVFTLKPKLNVYHRCHYTPIVPTCYQKFSIYIPERYITQGAIPQKVFKSDFNLEAKYPGQTKDCINMISLHKEKVAN